MESELVVIARHAAAAPVDFAALCAELGVAYCPQPIRTGESGWIERNGDSFAIAVNSNEAEVRQRFTAAHELAHYVLHRDKLFDGGRMNRHTDTLFDGKAKGDTIFNHADEVQANRLAAQIVMPVEAIRQRIREGMTVDDMAKDLKVSKAALEIRLKTLGYDRAAA